MKQYYMTLLYSVGTASIAFATTASAAECSDLNARWQQTTITLPSNSRPAPNDEYTPAVIMPMASGDNLLAWTERSTKTINLLKLNQNDQQKEALPSLAGLEVHDAIETSNGFALAIMDNDADIYSSKYCQSELTPDNAVCGKMDLLLLDKEANLKTRTTLTNKQNVDSNGAQFIWWYGHTARLATKDDRVMVYYRSAMSTDRPGELGEVDIHAGDTLKFVDANSGLLVSGGWDWGCSHSWSVRTASNENNWAALCHGDAYPNAMRMTRMTNPNNQSFSEWLSDTDPARRALGGLVSTNDGFWINYIEEINGTLKLKLAKYQDGSTSPSNTRTIQMATNMDIEYPFRAYMSKFGTDQLLLGWKSNGQLILATADEATGDILEGPVTTTLSIDNFQDIKSDANGDAIWAYSSGNGNTLQVNRVSTCH